MDVIFATKNNGKLAEIREIMHGCGISAISMTEAGIDLEVEENGKTFSENALKKAVEIMRLSGKIVLSDDSGLEIDFLNKAPGVYSARFLGEKTDYAYKNAKILEMLEGVPFEKRTARFVCAVACAVPSCMNNGSELAFTEEAAIEGVIAESPAGINGFGYDPIFYVPEFGMTAAEMPRNLKNKISHRGKALEKMMKRLTDIKLQI